MYIIAKNISFDLMEQSRKFTLTEIWHVQFGVTNLKLNIFAGTNCSDFAIHAKYNETSL